MKWSKSSKEKYKMYSFGRKGAPGRGMEPSLVLKDIKSLKKSLMLYRIESNNIRARPHPVSFKLVKRDENL